MSIISSNAMDLTASGLGGPSAAYTDPAANPRDHFQYFAYQGDGSSSNKITLGWSPDLVWIKNITAGTGLEMLITDSVQPAMGYGRKSLWTPMPSSAESHQGDNVQRVIREDDGFSLHGNYSFSNRSADNYIGFAWKAGGKPIDGNNAWMLDGVPDKEGCGWNDGSIYSTAMSVNSKAKFSITLFKGNGAQGASIGHGLGVAPSFILLKNTRTGHWWYGHKHYNFTCNTTKVYLNTVGANYGGGGWSFLNLTGNGYGYVWDHQMNGVNEWIIMYAWADVPGYFKSAKYATDPNNPPNVITGFEPSWVMFKNVSATSPTNIGSRAKNPTNPVAYSIFPTYANPGYDYASMSGGANFHSTGFQTIGNGSNSWWNSSGPGTIVYQAFA